MYKVISIGELFIGFALFGVGALRNTAVQPTDVVTTILICTGVIIIVSGLRDGFILKPK